MLASLINTWDLDYASKLIDILGLALLLCVVVMTALFVVYLVRSRRLQREISRSSEEVYYNLLPTLGLDAEDHALIKRLAAYLIGPQQKHRLLTNHQVFDGCASRFLRRSSRDTAAVERLRAKLGFQLEAGNELPETTRDLPTGQPLVVAKARGRVISSTAGALVVWLDGNQEFPPDGIPFLVHFQNKAGLFSFSTRVLQQDELESNIVQLEHAETLERISRRENFRQRISLPVAVRLREGNAPPVESELVDLSGGGASHRNPKARFKVPDALELAFTAVDGKITDPAKVLRTSRNGAVLHVRFEGLAPQNREHIVQLLRKTRSR